MKNLCYCVGSKKSRKFVAICRKESPHEITADDRTEIFNLLGRSNLSENSTGFFEVSLSLDGVATSVADAGMNEGGRAKIIMDYMLSHGYCDDWEE